MAPFTFQSQPKAEKVSRKTSANVEGVLHHNKSPHAAAGHNGEGGVHHLQGAAGYLASAKRNHANFKKRQGTYVTADMEGNHFREFFWCIFDSMYYDIGLAVVLFFNVFLLILETDASSSKLKDGTVLPPPQDCVWCGPVNTFLTTSYCVELLLRLYVFRSEFFKHSMNWLDLIIIASDVVTMAVKSEGAPNFTVLRVVRLIRLGRMVKLLMLFPELGQMLRGLVHAFRSIFWGMILITGFLTIWSIFAVMVIHPLNLELATEGAYERTGCERCPRAYETVWNALLTFTQQVIAGDSWGQTAMLIIERWPMSYIFFVGVLATVSMGILNLILAVIVDNSVEARKLSDEVLVESKEAEWLETCEMLMELCKTLDSDDSGCLTFDELLCGYEEFPQFRLLLQTMDMSENDMKTIFMILDEDRSGDVKYEEFVNQIYKMKRADSRTLQVFMQHYVEEILRRTTSQLRILEEDFQPLLTSLTRATENLDSKTGPGGVPAAAAAAGGAPAVPEKVVSRDPWEELARSMDPNNSYPANTSYPAAAQLEVLAKAVAEHMTQATCDVAYPTSPGACRAVPGKATEDAPMKPPSTTVPNGSGTESRGTDTLGTEWETSWGATAISRDSVTFEPRPREAPTSLANGHVQDPAKKQDQRRLPPNPQWGS